jgi:ATP-binding cassette subfamily F protein uup
MEKSGSRQKTIKLSYKEKQEFEQLEKEIATLEHEKAGMEKLLVSGSLSHEELHNISINMGRIIKEIDIKTERWIELSEKEL